MEVSHLPAGKEEDGLEQAIAAVFSDELIELLSSSEGFLISIRISNRLRFIKVAVHGWFHLVLIMKEMGCC